MPGRHSPLALIHAVTASIDAAIEDAIDAHGFSLAALSADEGGSTLRFVRRDEASPSWHLTFRLPTEAAPEIRLEGGEAIKLSLSVDGKLVPRLADAVRVALGVSQVG